MHQRYFGFSEPPFAITPDTRFFFLGQRHQEGLAHLFYSLKGKNGFLLLTGEVGAGKTTLCRRLIDQLPEKVNLAVIFHPPRSIDELLDAVLAEFGLRGHWEPDAGTLPRIALLNRFLLAAHGRGEQTILMVDEAQHLDAGLLEQLRLLTNLETGQDKLIQIILVGQPELGETLARPELRQLAQRITANFHLTPLDRAESDAYIRHRLRVAGRTGPLFSRPALALIHWASGGTPRLINRICERALLGAYARERDRIGVGLVWGAIREMKATLPRPRATARTPAFVLPVVLAVGFLAFFLVMKTPAPGRVDGEEWSQVWTAAADLADRLFLHSGESRVGPSATLPGNGASIPASPDGPLPPLRAMAAVEEGGDGWNGPAHGAPARVVAFEGNQDASSLWSAGLTLAPTASGPPWGDSIPERLLLSRAEAEARLLALWRGGGGPDPGGCGQAALAGLACFDSRGGWPSLRRLNLPVVLHLTGRNGVTGFVLVARLQGSRIWVADGAAQWEADRGVIDQFWQGGFTAAWRPPVAYGGVMAEGSRGADVRWLRAALELALGAEQTEPGSDPDLFDAALEARLEIFQRQNGLHPDGLAGPRTVNLLNHLLGEPPRESVPWLDRERIPPRGPLGVIAGAGRSEGGAAREETAAQNRDADAREEAHGAREEAHGAGGAPTAGGG